MVQDPASSPRTPTRPAAALVGALMLSAALVGCSTGSSERTAVATTAAASGAVFVPSERSVYELSAGFWVCSAAFDGSAENAGSRIAAALAHVAATPGIDRAPDLRADLVRLGGEARALGSDPAGPALLAGLRLFQQRYCQDG